MHEFAHSLLRNLRTHCSDFPSQFSLNATLWLAKKQVRHENLKSMQSYLTLPVRYVDRKKAKILV